MSAPNWLEGAPMDPAAEAVEPLPTLDGFPFLHRGMGAVIVGPTGHGRSSLVQSCLYDAAMSGVRCAYLGGEVKRYEFDARAALLADCRGDDVDDTLREQLARVRYLDLREVISEGWRRVPRWTEDVSASFDVVAIDPVSAVAEALDMNFDKNNYEWTRFYDRMIEPLTTRGVAVVMLDNIGHAEDARDRAKGASAKGDKVDLTFACKPIGDALILKVTKVRSVLAAFACGDQWIISKDAQYLEPYGVAARPKPFRPTNIMQKISEAIEAQPGLSRREITAAVARSSRYAGAALKLLVAEGYVEVRQDGQAHRHYSARAFRDEPTVDTVDTPWTNRGPETVDRTVDTVDHVLRTWDDGVHGESPAPSTDRGHPAPDSGTTEAASTQMAVDECIEMAEAEAQKAAATVRPLTDAVRRQSRTQR